MFVIYKCICFDFQVNGSARADERKVYVYAFYTFALQRKKKLTALTDSLFSVLLVRVCVLFFFFITAASKHFVPFCVERVRA